MRASWRAGQQLRMTLNTSELRVPLRYYQLFPRRHSMIPVDLSLGAAVPPKQQQGLQKQEQQPREEQQQQQACDPEGAAHGFADEAVVERLAALGVHLKRDPIARADAAGRLEGHTTHNFFVHDKKDKAKRMLVTLKQASTVNIKALAGLVGCKELRLCGEGETLLGSQKGCVTPLSLLYDQARQVEWVVDAALLEDPDIWRLGTSAMDAPQGTVADVPVAVLKDLLTGTGHWQACRALDVPS